MQGRRAVRLGETIRARDYLKESHEVVRGTWTGARARGKEKGEGGSCSLAALEGAQEAPGAHAEHIRESIYTENLSHSPRQ